MARTSKADQQTLGEVILDRLASSSVPASVKKVAAEFKSMHASLTSASNAADSARVDRDEALAGVGAADSLLDEAVITLASKMTGAQIGTRQNPFAGLSKHAPSALTSLAYADEVREVLALVAKVKKAKPPADVAKAAAECEKLAKGVTSALSKLSKPQLAYNKALTTRDALLPDWTKALDKLKKHAAVAWFDDKPTYRAIFALPERVQAPAHRRAKKVAGTNAGPTVPGTTPSSNAPTTPQG